MARLGELKIVRRSTQQLPAERLWDTNTLTTLGLYQRQPRALCAVAPHLLPGLRCEEDFCRGFWLPHGPVYPLHTRCQCVWPSPVACVAVCWRMQVPHTQSVPPRPRPSRASPSRRSSDPLKATR